MSFVAYLGLNYPIENVRFHNESSVKITERYSTQESSAAVLQHHLTTMYIVEIELERSLDDLNPQSKIETPVDYSEARQTLYAIIQFLRLNLQVGDYAQIYYCWTGEEAEDSLGMATVLLSELPIPDILTEERFLITFIND
ncbi:hypothetical protein [Kurthia sibirica]|uniref:Uncharacterized protein n=1 Tax=Kurthia sibirica TaxID=202750 RepID=A0A2U3ANF5_9BACL|nr:hypothetical protein [Kurthia sibirica]PWI26051.1 hypothetical protein DEX24_05850 [Kurthia sibirica]GEK34798.1 hypothetical protein KSI01_23310 [Kurthia sibirica]